MDFSLLGLWSQMGLVAKAVVIILLLMSMIVIGISSERFVAFRRGRARSLEYIRALQPLLTESANLPQAADLQKRWPDAPLSRVIGSGLLEYEQGRRAFGASQPDAVELELLVHGVGRSMDRAKKREIAGLQRGLPFLATVSSSAPFVGLFGTVFGIITAFQQMADPSKGGGGGLATVSAGISEALLTTAVGLAVAIVSVWFYNFFTTRIDELALMIDDSTGELADRLLHLSRDSKKEGRNASSSALGACVTSRAQHDSDRLRALRTLLGHEAEIERPQAKSDINVTPLVDVVLVLLIIFMVVTPLIASGVAVDLPRTAHHARKADEGKDIIISVTQDKQVYVGATRAARLEDLGTIVGAERRKFPDKTIFVKGDTRAPFGTIRELTEVLRAAQITDVTLGTEELPPQR